MAENKKNSALAVASVAASFLLVGSPQARAFVSTAWMVHSADLGLGRRGISRPSGLSVYEAVRVMRDNGFPVSAIAEMARVERKTIYSWMDGAAVVRPQNEERVRSLFSVLKEATGGDYRQLYRIWNQKDPDGGSIRDAATAEDLDVVALRERIEAQRSTMDYYSRLEAKRAERPARHRGNPVLDELPTVAVSS